MSQIINTVQDAEKAFGLPPLPDQAPAKPSDRSAEAATGEHAFPLSRSYEVRGVTFSSIAFRPPRGGEFWEFGDIIEWQMMGSGDPMRFENLGAIRDYAERCASIPGEPSVTGAGIIEALNLQDTLALRKAVTGFFRERDREASR